MSENTEARDMELMEEAEARIGAGIESLESAIENARFGLDLGLAVEEAKQGVRELERAAAAEEEREELE